MPLVSITYKSKYLFHGGNTGSNPVGDAKSFQQLMVDLFQLLPWLAPVTIAAEFFMVLTPVQLLM